MREEHGRAPHRRSDCAAMLANAHEVLARSRAEPYILGEAGMLLAVSFGMPELLRAYGEILRRTDDDGFGVLAVLCGVVVLLSATFAIGALAERIVAHATASRSRRVRRVR